MRDIHTHLELHEILLTHKGFIADGASPVATLHRAQCCEIDPLYSAPAYMKYFETSSEAAQWLVQTYRSSWTPCAVCCPPTDPPQSQC